MNILVAGGAGYIGSHTMVELLNAGHTVICVDNLYNASKKAIERVEEITKKKIKFYEIDLLDIKNLSSIFNENKIDAVIMFAGYKAVGESGTKPLEYYYNNLVSLMNITEVMRKHNCKNIIFSSSATVYGMKAKSPITEESYVGDLKSVTNPYGRTKLMIEQILTDIGHSDKDFKVVLLRYFNPVGAHDSGLIGEDPKGIPNNLMPYIAQISVGKRDKLHVFGNDYKTKDGTGVRDYIHVVDLSVGHVDALKIFDKDCKIEGFGDHKNVFIYNLGTGIGYSVLDVLHAYEKACGKELPYVIEGRREGDVDELYCHPQKIFDELGWKAKRDLDDMCKTSFLFQSKNPDGYGDNGVVKMVFEDK
jgi:UDP-glucose 4-epimerase